ncbi:MAG: hypothetical protein M0R77_01130 [Gammaproteobacteria bacterium]|nr:hypothetical protein [Acholeplasmataceae bacterium]MCK9529159.1 hypothetical protein [Gammaproteobacteria bacterium]
MSKKRNHQYTLIERIFDQRFRARVPLNATMSEKWIQLNGGTYVSGDEYWNEKINQQWQDCYLTISKMVDYARKGVPISILRFQDTKTIYDSIEAYLAHAEVVFSGMYDPAAYSDTLEDLVDLDRLANVIYKHAKFYEPLQPTGSNFINMLRGWGGMSMLGSQPLSDVKEDIHKRERTGMEDLFASFIDPDRLPVEEKKDPFKDLEDLV